MSQNRPCTERQCILLLVSLKIFHLSKRQNDETGPCIAVGRVAHLALGSFGSVGGSVGAGMGPLLAPVSLTYQRCVEMGLFRAQGKSDDAILATAPWEADTLPL